MSGGGRRPPSTRLSGPAMDSRRSITPPARRNTNGNAGYAAIVHDSQGRFKSKTSTLLDNDSPELDHSTNSAGNAMEIAPLQVTNMQEEVSTLHGIGAGDKLQLADNGNSQVKHGNASFTDSKLMDDGMLHEDNQPQVLNNHSTEEGNNDIHDISCVSASSSLSLNNFSDVHMHVDSMGNVPIVLHKSNSPNCNLMEDNCKGIAGIDKNSNISSMHGVCANASMGLASNLININAWKKPGVVPLPSLKDLGAGSNQDGVARLDDIEVQNIVDRFQVALVGRLFGRRLPFYHLNAELKRRWECFGHFKLLTVSSDCFICLFETVAARDNVLMGGPWVIAGQVIGLDVWSSGFSPSTMHGFVTPIWVRFPGLPLYCWGSNSLTHIASLLGKPIWIDQATAMMERGAYARVCVQIDLSKPLVASVTVLGLDGLFQQRVEYEGLTNFCFKCGRVGHKDIHCPNITQVHDKANINSTISTTLDGTATSPHKEVFSNSGSVPPCMGSKQQTNIITSHATSQTSIPLNGSVSAVHSSKPHGCMDDLDGLGPWMLVQRRRKQHHPPRRSPRSGLPPARADPMEATVQNLNNAKMQNLSSPQKQVSVCAANLQESHVFGKDESLVQPVSQSNEPMVFSSPPKNLGNIHTSSLDRVNSNRDMQHKIKSPLGKAKQVFYDAGPLLVESHKKRRPSIQSIGEDASSSDPG